MKGKITIVGLGAGDLNQLSLGLYKKLKNAKHLFIRTADHPVVHELATEGLTYTSFDPFYESEGAFENVYEKIAEHLLKEAAVLNEIIYAVPGHPLVAEKTVQLLIEEGEKGTVDVEIEGGQSFLDPLFASLRIDPIEGMTFVDALEMDVERLSFQTHLIICQVYDAFVASEVKLSLLDHLPYDYEIYVVTAAGSSEESIHRIPLVELDQSVEVNNLTSVYVPPVKDVTVLNHTFPQVRDIIRTLRGPDGCPWDKKQTHESLRKYLIEEAYEVLEAIEEEDDDHLAEELGDLLLQILLHAQIAEDEGYFNIYDVIRHLTDKMIRRHPHVFGDEKVQNAEDVKTNWEAIKKQEKVAHSPESLLADINESLPPLLKSLEMQKKAAKIGFDWENEEEVWDKIREEWQECRQELVSGDHQALEAEFGDLLFSVVNAARWRKIDPFLALERTNRKFVRRFNYIEAQANAEQVAITDFSTEKMNKLWLKCKNIFE